MFIVVVTNSSQEAEAFGPFRTEQTAESFARYVEHWTLLNAVALQVTSQNQLRDAIKSRKALREAAV